MEKFQIKPYDVAIDRDLPEMMLDELPGDGDPLEINGQLYFVCEIHTAPQENNGIVNVIPLVVRNPRQIKDIRSYLECLSRAHRKVIFRNKQGVCDLENCEEMIIH